MFLDYIVPIIATFAAIIALLGDTFWKKENKHKITRVGLYIILIGGLVITLINIYYSKKETEKIIKDFKTYIVKIQNHTYQLIKNDSINNEIKDSLNTYVRELKQQLIDVTMEQLDYEKNIRKENQKLIFENLKSEIEVSSIFLRGISDEHLNGFMNIEKTFTGFVSVDAFKDALQLLFTAEDRKTLKLLIHQITNINISIELVGKSYPGEARITNINSVRRYRDRILHNFKVLKMNLKKYKY